ncbi:ESX secretion-associated protein EspG [Actinophytocola sp.]|uniref:ESX secretion-associated protein EspG n=1 Tax=Actinophytocola sp. TaxID=1872138 RepID=UPI003D6B43C9
MSYSRSWSLSLPAVTVLFAELGLGTPPQPFEPDYPYANQTQRQRFLRAVHDDLGDRGLLRDGAPDGELAAALGTLADAPYAVLAVGRLEDGLLVARCAWTDRTGVCAVQRGAELVLAVLDPGAAVPTLVDLLPRTRAASGKSIRVPGPIAPPTPAPTRTRDGADDGVQVLTPVGEDRPAGQDMVDRIFANPVVRGGMFTPVIAGRDGHRTELPPMTWFDTLDPASGPVRHFTTTSPGPDGRFWTSYLPGDNARMAGSLSETIVRFARSAV